MQIVRFSPWSMFLFSLVSGFLQACMGMLRLVRAFTSREKIIKFDGCYHGHADGFLVQAGSGVATLGLPDSPGEIQRRFLSGFVYVCMQMPGTVPAMVCNIPDQ